VAARVLEHHEELTGGFEDSLDGDGGLTHRSVHHIMESLKERDGRSVRHPGMKSADHQFLIALELVNDRGWIHGEIAALGSLITAWMCDAQPEILVDRLDRCQVRRRPSEMDLGREQLRKGLASMPEFLEKQGSDSILRHDPVDDARFEALWEYLEAGRGGA
jgi:hypothetical protein